MKNKQEEQSEKQESFWHRAHDFLISLKRYDDIDRARLDEVTFYFARMTKFRPNRILPKGYSYTTAFRIRQALKEGRKYVGKPCKKEAIELLTKIEKKKLKNKLTKRKT